MKNRRSKERYLERKTKLPTIKATLAKQCIMRHKQEIDTVGYQEYMRLHQVEL